MESGDILTTIAEIAIAIAGFSSVIVALSPKPISEWSPIERFNFRVLLQVAAVTVFFSLIPLVLHRALSFDLAWRVALIFYGVVHLADVSSFLFRFPDHVPTVPKITSIIGLSIAISQLVIWRGRCNRAYRTDIPGWPSVAVGNFFHGLCAAHIPCTDRSN